MQHIWQQTTASRLPNKLHYVQIREEVLYNRTPNLNMSYESINKIKIQVGARVSK